jgi:hypothetical protein
VFLKRKHFYCSELFVWKAETYVRSAHSSNYALPTNIRQGWKWLFVKYTQKVFTLCQVLNLNYYEFEHTIILNVNVCDNSAILVYLHLYIFLLLPNSIGWQFAKTLLIIFWLKSRQKFCNSKITRVKVNIYFYEKALIC